MISDRLGDPVLSMEYWSGKSSQYILYLYVLIKLCYMLENHNNLYINLLFNIIVLW